MQDPIPEVPSTQKPSLAPGLMLPLAAPHHLPSLPCLLPPAGWLLTPPYSSLPGAFAQTLPSVPIPLSPCGEPLINFQGPAQILLFLQNLWNTSPLNSQPLNSSLPELTLVVLCSREPQPASGTVTSMGEVFPAVPAVTWFPPGAESAMVSNRPLQLGLGPAHNGDSLGYLPPGE